MTGNVAFDVVIGLVFIYLLYSLYATIMMEIISSLLGLRAKNLVYALSRMLKDEKPFSNKFQSWLARLGTTFSRIRGKSYNLTNNKLFEIFMKQSSIRYLGSGGLGNKPSYLASDIFYKALMDSIKMPEDDLSELAAFEFGLSQLNTNSDTRKHLESLLNDSKRDPVKFKILVENWFNETMDRSAGWFKQSTQCVLLLIGFVIVFVFNVNTLAIIKKLSTDKTAREELVKMATDYTQRTESLPPAADSAAQKTQLDSLRAIQDSLKADIINTQTILSGGWNIADSVKVLAAPKPDIEIDSANVLLSQEAYVVLHKSVDAGIIRKMIGVPKAGEWVKVRRFFYQFRYIFLGGNLWGYLLTVLALSLGAPFWFDLLNKLVKLRTSKPVEEDSALGKAAGKLSTSSKSAILNRVG